MNSILMSIQPKWCELIASGKKTIEVRKTAPQAPFRAFIYCTKDKRGRIGKPYQNYEHIAIWGKNFRPPSFVGYGGKIIGEFICDKVDTFFYAPDCYDESQKMYYITNGKSDSACLTYGEICNYGKGKTLYGLHITNLKIYDKPRELGEFKTPPKARYDGSLFATITDQYRITRPPQSWQYVETPDWAEEKV